MYPALDSRKKSAPGSLLTSPLLIFRGELIEFGTFLSAAPNFFDSISGNIFTGLLSSWNSNIYVICGIGC